MKSHLLITTAASAVALLASAPAAAQNFSGPRVEGRVGADATSISMKDTRDFNGRGNFSSGSYSADLSIGGEVGFDIEAGSFAFGAYAGADLSRVEEDFETNNVNFETGRNLTAGARAGFVVSPSLLLYGKAGYSNGRLRPKFVTGATAANRAQFAEFSRDRDGVHFGGGLQVAVSPRGYARLDYTHTRYESFDVNATTELRFNRNQVMAAIGLQF